MTMGATKRLLTETESDCQSMEETVNAELGPPRLSPWDRTVHHWKASILPDIASEVAMYTVLALIICIMHRQGINIAPPDSFFSAVSIVVAFLLVFRTNTAYDRFWEGRRLWTSITVSVRNFARTVSVNMKDSDSEAGWVLNALIDTIIAIKDYLRIESSFGKKNAHNSLGRFYRNPYSRKNFGQATISLDSDSKMRSLPEHTLRPLQLLAEIQTWVHQQSKVHRIDTVQQQILYSQIANLTDCYAQCQRVLKTPIPPAYRIHLKHITGLFCIIFPFSTVAKSGFYTVPISMAVFFVVIGVKAIGSEIENPFGYDYNDLPLDIFCEIAQLELEIYQNVKRHVAS